jgi:hypothetical protein
MEALQPVARPPRVRRWSRAASVRAWVRERLTTNPGRLALVTILVVVGAVLFGLIATGAERSRAKAAQAVQTETEPLLVQAVNLYSALSDANATATTTFLTGGLEPPTRLSRYLGDLRLASESLATLTRGVARAAGARTQVATITDQLPVYSGLVEAARAYNRQGLPVGAAYLRQASALLAGTILPAADQLFATEATRLRDDYSSGTASAALVVLILVAAVSLGLLVLAQVYVARLSRRILNVPMVLASVVLAALSSWAIVGLINEQNALGTAQHDGSDSVELLSATRVLVARAQSDESLTLVSRGSDQTYGVDFAAVIGVLAPSGELVREVAALAHRTTGSAAANQLATDFASYRSTATHIAALDTHGQIGPATSLAVGLSASRNSPSDRLSASLAGQIGAAQSRFASAAASATSSLSGLSIAIPVLTVLAATLALLGLRERLGEYR